MTGDTEHFHIGPDYLDPVDRDEKELEDAWDEAQRAQLRRDEKNAQRLRERPWEARQ